MDRPIPTSRVGKGSWFGCNRDPHVTPGGFSHQFKGKSHKQAVPKHRYRDASREVCEAANDVLLGRRMVRADEKSHAISRGRALLCAVLSRMAKGPEE